MLSVVLILLASILIWFRSRLAMQMELIALRHQLAVYKQTISRPELGPTDRSSGFACPGWRRLAAFVLRWPLCAGASVDGGRLALEELWCSQIARSRTRWLRIIAAAPL